MSKRSTIFSKSVIDSETATNLFQYLRDNIVWEEGVRSKKGFTRKAKPLIGDCPDVDAVIIQALTAITDTEYIIRGIYLNYYENGQMWTPNHSHKGTHQLVVSLGCSRNLHVGSKSYVMENGDSILFGSSIHGVPKDDSVDARISIATFMTPV